MSSGVSDQMKIPGNSVKNVEERNIPWSQQVDEASYENLASPTIDDNAAASQSSTQFQYPPFNAKENPNSSWNNYKSRKSFNNFETNKKYGKAAAFNNSKREEFQPNAWGPGNSRRIPSDNPHGTLNRTGKTEDGYTYGRLDNRPNPNEAMEEKKTGAVAIVAAPKKTTWASIASQPAKLTSRTTSTTSNQKKKGPGMPPPPMVPGKHNLDVNTWDLPNNNPPPVPSPPPPPVDLSFAEVSADLSSNIVTEREAVFRHEKGHKGIDFQKDDSKSNFNNSNFGRIKNSPNGHSRKNWPTQNPLHQNRQTSGSLSRRGDSGMGSGSARPVERRNQYSAARFDQEGASFEHSDENIARNVEQTSSSDDLRTDTSQAVLAELRDKNNYNPTVIDLEKASSARFFVIKSYSEDDIHRSIKYEIWCSTDHGNKRLDDAFKERHKDGGNILLFFSVNGSGHFCGMAQMMTAVDYNSTSSVWSQDKWKGKFKVKWIYVKDVPNNKLRHIRLENNDNKSVTNSRDTQEVPNAKGIEVLQILHAYKHTTSIFDDFSHYEKKQEEEVSSKKPLPHESTCLSQSQSPVSRHYNRQSDDREGRNGGPQKYFGGSGTNFRDRNSSHRGGYHNNYNDQRRFDGHRTAGGSEYTMKERDVDLDRENSDFGNRYVQKFDYNRRDDRMQSKHSNRERDFVDDHSKGDSRFRPGPRDMQKDNEHPNADRARGSDY